MKIVQLGKYYPPYVGGIENNVRQCCHALAADHEVTALVFNEEKQTVREKDGPVDVVRVGSLGRIQSQEICPTLGRELRRLRPDVVHLHAPNPLAMTFLQMHAASVPLVITHHCDIVRQRLLRKIFRPIYRRLVDRCDALIVYTQRYFEDCEELRHFRGVPHIIPHGTQPPEYLNDREFLTEAEALRQNIAGDAPLAAFVGRLVDYKGLPVLVEAARRIPRLHLVIGGSGPAEESLRRMVAEKGLEARIHLIGQTTGREKWKLLQASDMVVLPSLNITESFGQVLVEAQLCAKPTVVTNVAGGVNEVSLAGRTGLRVPVEDAAALAEALTTLAGDVELRTRLGREGRVRALERFTAEITDQKLRDVFRELEHGLS